MLEIISAIGELNGLSSQELNKLLKDSENFTIECKTDKGFPEQINMEKLASSLPLHLIATLLSPEREMQMGHVLRGVRLLHTLSDLASHHARLEQILLDDTKLSEQVLDLVLFMLIILAHHKEDNSCGSAAVLHSTLVACSLYILTSCLSSQWHDLVYVLLAHPKMLEIISAIGELNGLSSQELNKLLKDSENFTIECKTDKGFPEQINMEKLASSLPLHLIATLLSPEREMQMGHVLRGVRLLHTLSDLASRHARLEQILLDDTKLSEQVLDLVLFMLIILAHHKEDNSVGSAAVLHSTLVACSLYILTSCLSSQWHDLVYVLLAHPKADLFMDVAFDAVHEDIKILGTVLQTLSNELSGNISLLPAAGRTAHYICQQCEASLQFLLSLCQQKLFQDRVLKNKELCKHGGILSLVYSILKLNVPHNFEKYPDIVAAISRLKSKILSILLQLCESESLSYLDEVAGSPKSMHLAKAVALEFLDLLRVTFRSEGKQLDGPQYRSNPTGLLLLNALRLADIFSDDSNFRSFFMTNSIPVLADILSVPHEEFSLCWCSLKIPVVEEDATLEYDPFIAAGVALISLDNASENSHSAAFLLPEINSTCPINFSGMPLATYAQQRISYLVKIIANLHVFVPNICEEEERDLFLNNFHKYLLQEDPESSGHHSGFNIQKATRVCKNLGSLSRYAISLTPNCLTDEDVLLLSKYADELQKLTRAKVGDSFFQETVVKVEGEDVKPEYGSLVQQSSLSVPKNSNSNFSRSHQETEYATPNSSSFTSKQDESAWEDGPKLSYNDVDAKGKIREISRCQDLLQQKVMRHSANDQFEEFEVNHERKRNSVDQPESLRGGERENTDSELKGTGLHLNKMDSDSMPDNMHFAQSEYLTESYLPEDEKAENGQGEEKQPRKRKRNIMNEIQILMIEKALLDEPEMQRNPAALQTWSDKLSLQGSEITASQLKNWVNNRKAKLARAAREARAPSEGDISYPDKLSGPSSSHFCDSPESPTEENYAAPSRGISHQSISRTGSIVTRSARCEDMDMSTPTDFVHRSQQNQAPLRSHLFEPGQLVSMEDVEGNLVGKGQIIQVEGRWHGKNLEESGICIVDVTELQVENWKEVQHPSDAAGHTFEEAMAKNNGAMLVAWDAASLALLP